LLTLILKLKRRKTPIFKLHKKSKKERLKGFNYNQDLPRLKSSQVQKLISKKPLKQ
jgi:hypothetical protein